VALAAALALGACASARSREDREARLARINVYPANYKTDVAMALRAYVSDPTDIRDAFIDPPALRPVGTQNRYASCVRFNAKNGEGRYTGSRDVMAVFSSGRFDQFAEAAALDASGEPTPLALQVKEHCAQAEYGRFPEVEALRR
jgi:hypothetical protein